MAALIRYASVLERRDLDAVPLGQELEIARRYLGLESLRLSERMEVGWEIDPGLETVAVPPFSLQVLLENAIKHGIAPKEEGGRIRIRIREEGGGLAIEVEDDGIGIPSDRIGEVVEPFIQVHHIMPRRRHQQQPCNRALAPIVGNAAGCCQHIPHFQQVMGGAGGEHRAAEAALGQQRQAAGVVQVGMGQHHRVDGLGVELNRAGPLGRGLVDPLVDDQLVGNTADDHSLAISVVEDDRRR